ncbi:MAG: hypothetical protein NT154_48160, partial [Verrucomicrobia bacterium]|nr:hypothetical protein [Verrucomicrobiota bacterium]
MKTLRTYLNLFRMVPLFVALVLALAVGAASADPIDLRSVAATAVTASSAYSGYEPVHVSDWSGM